MCACGRKYACVNLSGYYVPYAMSSDANVVSCQRCGGYKVSINVFKIICMVHSLGGIFRGFEAK